MREPDHCENEMENAAIINLNRDGTPNLLNRLLLQLSLISHHCVCKSYQLFVNLHQSHHHKKKLKK